MMTSVAQDPRKGLDGQTLGFGGRLGSTGASGWKVRFCGGDLATCPSWSPFTEAFGVLAPLAAAYPLPVWGMD